MAITITCSACKKTLSAPDSAVGKKVRCPACQAIVAVPMPDDLVEPEELVEPEPEPNPETYITETPPAPKQSGITDKGSPTSKRSSDEDGGEYGLDEDDKAERARRKRQERRRREDEDDYGDMRPRRRLDPDRGVLILVLGIVSLFGACLCAFIGWGLGGAVINMANTDLAKMDNGAMDSRNRGLTTAGKACAIIGVGIGLINAILGIAIRMGAFAK